MVQGISHACYNKWLLDDMVIKPQHFLSRKYRACLAFFRQVCEGHVVNEVVIFSYIKGSVVNRPCSVGNRLHRNCLKNTLDWTKDGMCLKGTTEQQIHQRSWSCLMSSIKRHLIGGVKPCIEPIVITSFCSSELSRKCAVKRGVLQPPRRCGSSTGGCSQRVTRDTWE